MREERLEILQMVRDGVIAVEEAERLLAAIEEGDRRRGREGDRSPWEDVARGLSGIGRSAASTVQTAVRRVMRWPGAEELERVPEFSIEAGESLYVENEALGGGSIRLGSTDGDVCRVECEEEYGFVREDDGVRLRWKGGPITVHVPTSVASLSAHTMGGEIEAEAIPAPMSLQTLGGALRLLRVSAPFDATTFGGGILLRIERLPGDSKATTMGGTIDARVGPDFAGVVHASSLGGRVEFEPGLGLVRREPRGHIPDAGTIEIGREPHATSLKLESAAGRVCVRRES